MAHGRDTVIIIVVVVVIIINLGLKCTPLSLSLDSLACIFRCKDQLSFFRRSSCPSFGIDFLNMQNCDFGEKNDLLSATSSSFNSSWVVQLPMTETHRHRLSGSPLSRYSPFASGFASCSFKRLDNRRINGLMSEHMAHRSMLLVSR